MAEAHLSLLLEMIELLERYSRTVTRKTLEADRETWLKVKAALELAAQCAIDLALAIVADRALGTPQTYREAFGLLARAKIVDRALGSELEAWAGLRNVLVHIDTALDLDKLHAALGHIQPLRDFHAIAARELSHDPRS